jgi:hypothetical protein
MRPEIPQSLRRLVIERAGNRCEYCLLPQWAALHKHEPDHLIPHQHDGRTEESNLALACLRCNRYKGPNVGAFDPVTGQLVPLFNPRLHKWSDHFVLEGATIRALTAEARVTIKLFHLNDEDHITERRRLVDSGLYG